MRRTMNALLRTLALVGLGAAASVAAPRAEAQTATVNITVDALDFKGTKGQAIFALYDSKETWLKAGKAVQEVKTKITGKTVQVIFKDVKPGIYAISIIHDENMNGKMDLHWLPVPGPDEGAGVSNDASATIGPPSYSDARFRLGDKNSTVTIHMRY